MLEKCDFFRDYALQTRVSIECVEEWNQKDNRAAYNEGDLYKVLTMLLKCSSLLSVYHLIWLLMLGLLVKSELV